MRTRAAIAAGALVAAVAVLVGTLLAGESLTPPTCRGEAATIVLVPPGTAGDYDFGPGVEVQDDPDGALLGTPGRDVSIAIQSTDAGGIISSNQRIGGLLDVGDVMCEQTAFGPPSGVIYGSRNQEFGDVIETRKGNDNIYGYGGPDLVKAGAGVDRIWGGLVEEGVEQHLYGGPGQDHFYVGKGAGTVYVYGGSAPTDVKGGGDHIHPCPVRDREETPEQLFKRTGIVAVGIEYIGPESAFTTDAVDPCNPASKSL